MKENPQGEKLVDYSLVKQGFKHLKGLENRKLTIRKHQIKLPEGKISPKYFSTSFLRFSSATKMLPSVQEESLSPTNLTEPCLQFPIALKSWHK